MIAIGLLLDRIFLRRIGPDRLFKPFLRTLWLLDEAPNRRPEQKEN